MNKDWFHYRRAAADDPQAAERGRFLTAQGMAVDTEGRKRMEDFLGVDFCRRQYPEAYKSGFARLLDRVINPWHKI